MADDDKKNSRSNSGINPIVAGVTGAIVGAGFAVAGAVALKDEKNRKKVIKVFNDLKSQAKDTLKDSQKIVIDKKEEILDKENELEFVTPAKKINKDQ